MLLRVVDVDDAADVSCHIDAIFLVQSLDKLFLEPEASHIRILTE